ncbi:PEP-CTERM sorting domain-containing protein [Nostoc sp. FACHB-152]|nr:PEP-CTERM sorting domain-containing protein [Nostoc sp. FACHB-152]MBD2472796.1 PEP-CTERM sorting domain-containing protein [Nostoc sp. FACHB-145]
MKLAKNLVITSIAAISVAAIGVKPAQAALLKYDFKATTTLGKNPGEYFGSLSFDDSTLTNVGIEDIGVEDGLKLAFNYLGNNYTELDDDAYDKFPIITFNNGNLLGLSYLVSDQFLIGSDENTPDIGGNRFYSIQDIDGAISAIAIGTVTYTKVPEPLSLGGVAIVGTLGLWLNRKKKS